MPWKDELKRWKIDRIISIATLVTSIVALVLVLKKPVPVALPQSAAQAAANAQSFQEKLSQLDGKPSQPAVDAPQPGEAGTAYPGAVPPAQPAEVRITSDEVSAALAQVPALVEYNARQLALYQRHAGAFPFEVIHGTACAISEINRPGAPTEKVPEIGFTPEWRPLTDIT